MSLLRLPACCAVLLALAALENAHAEDTRLATAAEKIRAALAEPRDLDIPDQPLDAAVNLLREQTGVNFVIDQGAVPPQGLALAPGQLASYAHLHLSALVHGRPLREVLPQLLAPHNLTCAIVGDTAYITTPDKAIERQFNQLVHLEVDSVALKDVLLRLGRETGANILADPRQTKALASPVTAHFHGVPLEAVVRLAADQADLEVARVSNVLYVTAAGRAEKIQKQATPLPSPVGYPAGPLPAGGLGGIPGAPAGLGGLTGIAGALGALGIGGGLAGIGGVTPPMPLSPPLPGKPAPPKPKGGPQPPPAKTEPGKPKSEPAPPAKPVVAPAAKDVPKTPPENKPQPASRPADAEKKGRRNLRQRANRS
jgi:hypothetical protein